jgi:beta-lactamase class A
MRKWLALLLLLWSGVAAAQEPSPELRQRIGELATLLRGQGDPATLFTPAFLAQVPAAQVRAIGTQLAGQYGAIRGEARITPVSASAARFDFDFERATVHMNVSLDPAPPHLVNGWFITGADMTGDSFDAVVAEVSALPGTTGFAVARLGDGAPVMLASIGPDRPLAIGSAFKLFILAELQRQIGAGRRHWSDVVPLDQRSIPSGVLQTWPRGAPVTLHTLAAQMISVSDNTAADTLLHVLGRENVEAMMATLGVTAAARDRPLLSTLEMAALKTGPAAALDAWRAADEAGRRRQLAALDATADAAHIDISRFSGNPLGLDVEWYASAADLVRTMDWLRRHGDESAHGILAINTGLGPVANGFFYVGYKGGSEPGVLNLSWLVRTRAGVWHVVIGSWNNPAAPLDEARFIGLMARAVQLLR